MNIEEIAGVHLGKAGDGSAVKPYVTPDQIDPSLLVAVPRVLNRVQYGIDESDLPFDGYDVWNCYEVSALLQCGAPISGVMKLRYPSNSESIVESKSLKLFLNSFNMHVLNTNEILYAKREIELLVQQALASLLNTSIAVEFNVCVANVVSLTEQYPFPLEHELHLASIAFDHYNESSDILVGKESEKPVDYYSELLRSNCRVTNQPDWGDVYVYIDGDVVPTEESFLQYIVSMRKENHFHEEICECIYKRLWDKFSPRKLAVGCFYTRRGGIDINPIRVSDDTLYTLFQEMLSLDVIAKTVKQ